MTRDEHEAGTHAGIAQGSSDSARTASGIPLVAWIAMFAVVVRLVAFLGRGDYVAYDEAWYVLLGRNLLGGHGYTLAGMRHVALSPLYPVIVGIVDALVGNGVLAGRFVAAVFGGLLVVPCWSLFHRLAGQRVAAAAALLVAVMPALAPFAAPKWVGWDLWVGAEPVLHFFLFGGVALFVRYLQEGDARDALLGGASFALAYLARAEAVLLFGVVGLACALAIALRRTWRRLLPLLGALAVFAAVSFPYWMYLHDALGRWTLTGRVVQVAATMEGGGRSRSDASARIIERMLWRGDYTYAEKLYALDASGTRMASNYWGVPPDQEDTLDAAGAASEPRSGLGAGEAALHDTAHASDAPTADAAASPWRLFARTMRLLVPLYVWPFLLLGFVSRRRMHFAEALVLAAFVLTSAGIAIVVAVDPRTQLFLLPLIAFYAGAGAVALGEWLARRASAGTAWIRLAPAGMLASVLFVQLGLRTYHGATELTGAQEMGTEFARVGDALREIVPPDESIVSWHPSVAVHARRDWHPLPLARTEDVLRYANAVGSRFIVFGGHNPSALRARDLPREYLILIVKGHATSGSIRIVRLTPFIAYGVLGG